MKTVTGNIHIESAPENVFETLDKLPTKDRKRGLPASFLFYWQTGIGA